MRHHDIPSDWDRTDPSTWTSFTTEGEDTMDTERQAWEALYYRPDPSDDEPGGRNRVSLAISGTEEEVRREIARVPERYRPYYFPRPVRIRRPRAQTSAYSDQEMAEERAWLAACIERERQERVRYLRDELDNGSPQRQEGAW